jgi:nucleoside-diphosphate-sugar epimerase
VILLAGHSSVKMCDRDMVSSFNNNVVNFINLLSKISLDQKFIYASSSSVYGNTNYDIVKEDYMYFDPNNYYDLTKHTIDLYAMKSEKNIYGLRFGTVNGWSPNLRTDVMINSMVNSALIDGHIKLYIKHIMRAILGIDDLVDAIQTIIDSDKNYPGIYNLASFNKTAEEIAIGVSKEINIPIKEYDCVSLEKITNVKLQTSAYNFGIDSNKFIELFNFTFKNTIESITKSLVDGFDKCNKSNRNEIFTYE